MASRVNVVNKSILLSQQGLYRKLTETCVSGAISFKLRNESDEASQEALVRFCQAVYNINSFGHQWIVGFSYEFSKNAVRYLQLSPEDFSQLDLPDDEHAFSSVEGDEQHFKNNRHHAIILTHADNVDMFLKRREALRELIADTLDGIVDIFETFGIHRKNMKILGGRFFDGTNNAKDYVSLERYVLKTRENNVQGSTFLFTQMFEFDQSTLGKLTDEEMENIIGRTVKHQQFIGSNDNTVSHVERMRAVTGKTGLSLQMLRLPYLLLTNPDEIARHRDLRSEDDARQILETCDTTIPCASNSKRENHLIERGLYFAGFCRNPARIKEALDVLSGRAPLTCDTGCPVFMSPDRILTFMNGAAGGYFWIPSARILSVSELPTSPLDGGLHPIWNIEQRNDYMYFNMQQWSHAMSTGKYLNTNKVKRTNNGTDDIPSNRILHLCSATFDRWKARWIKDTPHVQLPHLEQLLIENQSLLPADFVDLNGNLPDLAKAKKERGDYCDSIFADPPMGNYIKDIPVVMRKGLAIREQLRLFTDINRPDIIAALDTYRLEPGELIVGTLEEYSLASGKLAVEYLCYGDERNRAKAATLSELSAMGHIVPDYGIILQKGLAAMIADLEDRISQAASDSHINEKVHFWKGARYALEGIDVYLANYAELAKQIRLQIKAGDYEGPNTMIGLQCNRNPELFLTDFCPLKRVMKLPIRFKIEKYRKKVTDEAVSADNSDSEYLWTPTKDHHEAKHYEEIMNLESLENMLQSLRKNKPETFLQAVQLFFVTHASLHLTADPTSAGRLDQLFQSYYEDDLDYYRNYIATKMKTSDRATRNKILKLAEDTYSQSTQDIIDALCLKWSEKVNFNMTKIPDATSFGTTAVMFGTGPFASGDSNNQWFHQVSLGGMKANANQPGEDGCNDVTLLFLRALRRLPLTAPCLSLRVNSQTKSEILEESAKAILSGGAHPIIFHDTNVSKGIHDSLSEAYKGPENSPHYSAEQLIALSRQYSCDGCYEPVLSGYSDFSFLYVPLLQSLECALNRGATYMAAGAEYRRGKVINWSSPPVESIQSFEHLLDITIDFHLTQMLRDFYNIPLAKFGSLSDFCPSPLLSCLMHNSIERGRDLTRGGTMVHIITPMLVGLSNFIDSLFAIKVMVYDSKLKVTTLVELTQALISNWGERDESWKPFVSATRIRQTANRYAYLRQLALSLPKFGGPDHVCNEHKHWIHNNSKAALRTELNQFGKDITTRVILKAKDVARNVYNDTNMMALRAKYADPDFPFNFTVCIGAGTFENYVGVALDSGASADGRLAGQPIASDCSPAPSPIDLAPLPLSSTAHYREIRDALLAYDHESFRTGFGNACELDVNIKEETSVESLHSFIRRYATDEIRATSIITFTTGDPDRYEAGITQPQQYELYRVRMGGWTNFYIAQWLVHQKQHQRRPFYRIEMESTSLVSLAKKHLFNGLKTTR